MKKLGEQIKKLVEAEAAEFNAFVVGQSSGEQGLYRYYVDAEGTLTLNTLAEITRRVSRAIDEGDFGETPFTFEVSSPGAEKPLTDIRQFSKHVGRNFEVTTADGEFEAKLLGVMGSTLSFERSRQEKINGKKQVVTDQLELPLEHIKSAIIKISFR